PAITAVAVLPLRILAATDAGRYLGLAIADSLITQLGTNSAMAVRSTGAVVKYTETDLDPLSIGEELGVDAVVSGTLHTIGEKIRVNIQITNVHTSETLWASKFENRTDDFFALQDKISEEVAAALDIKLHKALSVERSLHDAEIYQSYLKYRFFWETRTESGLLMSLSGANKIVAADPTFPLGYIGVADSYLLLGHHLFLSPEKILPAVDRAVHKALELAPDLPEAHASLADLYFISRKWVKAEETYQESVKLNPNYASSRHWYGWYLLATGRFDESLEQIHQAQRLDPNSLYLGTVCGIPLLYKEEYERAIAQFRMILEVKPDFNRARYYLALSLFHAGDRTAGIAEFERVVAAEPIQQTIGLLGYCYGATGRHDDARQMLRQIEHIESHRYVEPYVKAWVLNGMGEIDQALTQLERAFDGGSIWLVWMKIDKQFLNLRREPRFLNLVKKMDFPDQSS
ncbi:MAG TPA: tetratricopeptide repeat protein, partial [Pyrinomonadaceae bacterium]|nr:tetratricopeptide repeat protein [Pyrinomonadaceae bacterium]